MRYILFSDNYHHVHLISALKILAEGSLLYRYYRNKRFVKIMNGTDPLWVDALEALTGNDFENDVSYKKKKEGEVSLNVGPFSVGTDYFDERSRNSVSGFS